MEKSILSQWERHKNKVVDTDEAIVFFYIHDDSLEQRKDLKRFLTWYRGQEQESNDEKDKTDFARIVVVGDTSNTFMNFYGWEEDIDFCFSLAECERSMKHMVRRLVRYPFHKECPIEQLKTRSKGRIDLDPMHGICFLKSDGAYTEIHMSNGKIKLESKRLKYFEELLSSLAIFNRVNRFFILNRNRVLTVDNLEGKVIFLANVSREIKIAFKPEMLKRIKVFVYWY